MCKNIKEFPKVSGTRVSRVSSFIKKFKVRQTLKKKAGKNRKQDSKENGKKTSEKGV